MFYKQLVLTVALVAASVTACTVIDVNVGLKKAGETCLHTAECAAHEVCIFAKCSDQCGGDRDCPRGRCLGTSPDGNACVPIDLACPEQSCPVGSFCSGGTCRNGCGVGDAGACLGDQICSATNVCVGTLSGHDPAATSSSGGSGGAGGSQSGGAGGTTSTGGISGAAGSGGSVGTGGAVSGGGTDGGTGDRTGVGVLGNPCPENGATACNGHAQQQQLVCVNHVWGGNGKCSSPANYNCDSTPGATAGTCQPIVAHCIGKQPGDVVCQDMNRVRCGLDLTTTTPVDTCAAGTETCANGACVTCSAGTANCDGNAGDCETNLNSITTCGTTCGNQVACSAANGAASCTSGACGMNSCASGYGDCTAGNNGCETNLNLASTCGTTCGNRVACASPTPACSAGACVAPPSCKGLSANCGPSSNESCCLSPLVTGGTYNRSNEATVPATVSNFLLDKYEITVGRFRKFVAAYSQNMIPAGAGKNPNNASDPGWDAAQIGYLPADAAALQTALACHPFQTWTASPASYENLPINCVNWFEVDAFCIWDGGRLPTEAEWNYAAAGGSEQRTYPWGSTAPGPNADLAIYGCYFNWSGQGMRGCQGPLNNGGSGSVAPVGTASAGNGKYGQADLAGNAMEWTLDYWSVDYQPGKFDPPLVPCTNCAYTTASAASDRVIRGGNFGSNASDLLSSFRSSLSASTGRNYATGSRCARTP